MDASENNFDEKVTAPNLKDSDSDNSGSGRENEVMREYALGDSIHRIAISGMLPEIARIK